MHTQSDHQFVEFRRYWLHTKTGEINTQLWKLIQPGMKLTFNQDYKGRDTTKASPFLEVETMRPEQTMTEATKKALSLKRGGGPDDMDEAVSVAIDALSSVLLDHWHPQKFHLILCSGGYDSRILASLIKWLDLPGNYLFLSNRWEKETFRKLMKAVGVKKDNYFVYTQRGADNNFKPSLTNFKHAYQELNAPCAKPANFWWYLPRHVQQLGLVPKNDHNIQIIGGYWHNELADCFIASGGGNALRPRYLAWYPYHIMSSVPQKAGSVLFPFTHIQYVKTMSSFNFTIPTDNYRRRMSDRLVPEMVDIKPYNPKNAEFPISKRLLDRAKRDYLKSWFGSTVRPESVERAQANGHPSTWWSDRSLASLCEYAIDIGATISCE